MIHMSNTCVMTNSGITTCDGRVDKRNFFWPTPLCDHHYDIRMTVYLAALGAEMVKRKQKGWE